MKEVAVFQKLALAVLVATCAGQVNAASAEEKQALAEIRQVLDAQEKAWNRGDIDGFMQGYARSEQTTFVSGKTVTRGWQTVRDRYKRKYDTPQKMGRLTFSTIKIALGPRDSATATGRWMLRRNTDAPSGRFTLLLRRKAEGWRIVRDETTSE